MSGKKSKSHYITVSGKKSKNHSRFSGHCILQCPVKKVKPIIFQCPVKRVKAIQDFLDTILQCPVKRVKAIEDFSDTVHYSPVKRVKAIRTRYAIHQCSVTSLIMTFIYDHYLSAGKTPGPFF